MVLPRSVQPVKPSQLKSSLNLQKTKSSLVRSWHAAETQLTPVRTHVDILPEPFMAHCNLHPEPMLKLNIDLIK